MFLIIFHESCLHVRSSPCTEKPIVTEQTTTDTLPEVVFWPSPQDYCEALQTPQESLSCPELKAGAIELDNLGLPRPISGGFASVYKVITAAEPRAVRCFLLKRADQHERYSLISEHLNSNPLPSTVDFDYIADGIKVGNSWFPIVDMSWIQGETLDQYLLKHYRDAGIVSELCAEFVKMTTELRRAGIAHGDLQHGNILVMPDRTLKLVDYDGMFVSSMSGMQSCELGHSNYQHPKRTSEHFDATLDNFSALTIFTTLKAIAADPRLVDRLDALNECSLFRASDFNDPLASKAFHLLERHKNEELGKLSRLIRQYLEREPGEVPALTDLPSEPDEYIFSLGMISADLLSADFLNAKQSDSEDFVQELIQQEREPAKSVQDEAEPGQKLKQAKSGSPLVKILLLYFIGCYLFGIGSCVGRIVPPDRTDVEIAQPQIFAVTRDGVNIANVMDLQGRNHLVVVNKASNEQLCQEKEAKGSMVSPSGFSLCKRVDPAYLTPSEFDRKIRQYLDQARSPNIAASKTIVDPSYLLELVIPDHSLSNEQIKVLEQISKELASAYAEKRQLLKVIVPVKFEY